MRSRYLTSLLLLILAATVRSASADAMAMRDYHLLDIGMSQAEVMYRVGPPDRESVFDGGYYGGTTKIIWYYIPERSSSAWITEIIFDANGEIRDTKRYKP